MTAGFAKDPEATAGRTHARSRSMAGFGLLMFLFVISWSGPSSLVVGQEPQASRIDVPDYVADTLDYYCAGCHGGDEPEGQLSIDELLETTDLDEDRGHWEKIERFVRTREMPPEGEDEPSEAERLKLRQWISDRFNELDCGDTLFPGRVTIRRLNRAEYNNTIRDLTGVDFQPADEFPSDDVGNGFDNMGDVLSMPPLLVEKYLDAAERIVDEAFASERGRQLIVIREPENDDERLQCAVEIIRHFAERAYRRPLAPEEQRRLIELGRVAFDNGADYEQTLKYVVQAILVSPHFLFRVEGEPDNEGDGIHVLNDFELASRLSYFLWSTMPDEELMELAREGQLKRDDVLIGQVERMLADKRSMALVENFAGQWLQLRSLNDVVPDPQLFPAFDDQLRAALRTETETFFETVMDEDRSILDFLTADFTFVDQTLAQHYGLTGVDGDEFRRVQLPGQRRGILTHGSILLITSNPTRTSPVKRGKWILENMLGEPPPPPPDGVEELEEQAELLGSLRERMEQHRANEACAVCHRTMDTLGFGLENFDVTGAWRDQDGRHEIDASGALPGGINFANSGELMRVLADSKKEDFCRCLTEKMLTYALGRGLQTYDRCTVNIVLNQLEFQEYRFSTLIRGIVLSEPFRKRAATKDKP